MVVESEDGSGTAERITESEKARTFCLSDSRAIRIASIGAAVSSERFSLILRLESR